MMDDFAPFRSIKTSGGGLADILRAARAAGHGDMFCIRMLRDLYGLSLMEAKNTLLEVEQSSSVREYQRKLAIILEEMAEKDDFDGE